MQEHKTIYAVIGQNCNKATVAKAIEDLATQENVHTYIICKDPQTACWTHHLITQASELWMICLDQNEAAYFYAVGQSHIIQLRKFVLYGEQLKEISEESGD